ncbi:hypothetical protein HOT49_gp066 [Erwinia phage vB_EamM_Alexandra]|uniref:Uncharacterized protein n=2 Tax=Alexandravirus TaxID=2733088 RepID=A0AAE8C237_9CAUD|nr:hypothetical protein HOT49_gp066 [Erwinia phage vB_EamM_Alexandra]YP_010300167.1 hypothetical protein MPK65_gp062 [Erwinia phage pEa_SNUABM_35]AWY08346.1 hypothetical protein Alexandra_66 [Erwinia phage vB_EamM_Alexandra]QZE59979.1 hypothetical protein pEaSNUABM35_00062 [Erwinia phage pEa_SNUABM_35]QZE60315.1 hypothetical protein pEaSNUABM36_00062 [Erwinia phage pEa_SNUABM_36]
MAALSLHLFEKIDDEKAFTERRFHKSIMFMHGVSSNSPYAKDSQPVTFAVYEVGDTRTYAATVGHKLSEQLQYAMNLEPVRVWQLVRRGNNVYFVGDSSEAIVADNVVPMEIRVEGGQDAERCWATS